MLLEAVYRDGRPLSAVAADLGVHPATAGRRMRRVLGRAQSTLFAFVLTAQEAWPRRRRAVARLAVLEGRPIRMVATHLGLTQHRVRRELDLIRAMHDATARRTFQDPVREAGADFGLDLGLDVGSRVGRGLRAGTGTGTGDGCRGGAGGGRGGGWGDGTGAGTDAGTGAGT
ncbi:MAG: hypothetical protein KDA25_05075, partial [Phycisphaerales bacterium]|nr:hypothetical protein [Phycisphaerales bacterium]